MDPSPEGHGVMERLLLPDKALLRNLLTNGGKTVGPCSNLCPGAGLLVCIDVVWVLLFSIFFNIYFTKK